VLVEEAQSQADSAEFMTAKVSICVPNLNYLPFLPERFETIFKQSFQDWELLVYDSYSEDGAWDYISGLARREPRMRAWQGPREVPPGGWNPCLRKASGEYVYMAPSDDTVATDCLEKLVAALDAHPDCDLAHCPLRTIDETGSGTPDWWSESSTFALSSGKLLFRPHLRKAPFDGLLHLLGETVYICSSQLLIRRSLFDRIGFFESRWGSIADFAWDMRAGLASNVVHVPDTWGGWRIHPNQASARVNYSSPDHASKIDQMIESVIEDSPQFLAPRVCEHLNAFWAARGSDLREFLAEIRRPRTPFQKTTFLLGRILSGSPAAREYGRLRWRNRHPRNDWPHRLVQNWLKEISTEPILVPI
jgi:GT2 family glycosyltransferase